VSRRGGPLGDYLRAASALAGEDVEPRRAIAALLGLELGAVEPAEPSDPGADTVQDPPPEPRVAGDTVRDEVRKPPEERAAIRVEGMDDAWLEPLEPAEVRRPAWLDEVPPFPEATGASAAAPPVPEPLFVPAWRRALLRGLMATRDRGGDVDVERVVEGVARGEVLPRLPRLPRTHLGPAAQVLLDTGPSMAPFADDQVALLEDLRRLVPFLEELVFETTPRKGAGPADAWPLPAYRPPAPGTPVLVVSDLGAARGAGTRRAPESDWLEFSARVRRARCPLVALVPFPVSRVPPALRRGMAVVPWDRSTTTGRLRALLRAAGRGA
jgi:hypothetical protein